MELQKKEMKILGGRNLPPPWKRFNRLQATAQLLLRTKRPRGIFRFKTFEELEEWKMNCSLSRLDFPQKTT